LVLEGESVRYGAIVALGASRLAENDQRALLHGETARDLAMTVVEQCVGSGDHGAIALAVWAGAETGALSEGSEVLTALADLVVTDAVTATVDTAWALTALLASRDLGYVDVLARRLVERLLAAQGDDGIFPHILPPGPVSRLRRHVGCFADQVYPIQALARYHAMTADPGALQAANRCAARICALQGTEGQWWWHYDSRTGRVVEGYPVYSVHQHAMAPMALSELYQAGGQDCSTFIAAGLAWLDARPETTDHLVSPDLPVVWRKVGRHEPPKAVRRVRAVSTALHPRVRLGWLDRIFPANRVDHECRPYELGWLLYAWPTARAVGPPPSPADPVNATSAR